MADQLTCGEALIRLLERYEVDTVFGIPGAHTLDLYRGLATSNIRHVLARHEQGAGFMADGYARVSGKPGICVVISGPGVTNAATALGQAYADSIPVLLISSVTPTYSLHKGWGCLHEISDQQTVTAPLTGLSATALSPDDLPELVGQAFSIFAASRPRPVHIAIPTDVLARPASGDWSPRKPPSRAMPDPAAVQAAAELLSRAERPLVLVGGGANGAVAELAEWLNAGVITSNAGKGILPDSHPLNLGASLSRAAARRYLGRADVILAIGTEIAETDSFVERLEINGRLIRVDIDAGKMNDMYPAEIGIQADAGAAVAALLEALKSGGRKHASAEVQEGIAAVREELMADLTPTEQQHHRLLRALRAALPADSVVMADVTQIAYTGSFAFPVEGPRLWFYAAGYCTLGCALPMAIGAKIAAPQRPVAVLAGDAGFLFTVQELATAVELRLPLPIIVWNNEGLGEIRDSMNARAIPLVGVNARNPNFVALAEAFGGRGVRPASPEALVTSVTEALQARTPTLIEVRQDADWLA